MEVVFQISALSVVAAVCCCVIRPYVGSIAIALAAFVGVIILLLAFQFFEPVIDLLERLCTMSGLSGAVTAPLVKVVGIGILTQIAGAICDDAGERALHQTVEIAGSILSLFISLPLVEAVLELLEDILRG